MTTIGNDICQFFKEQSNYVWNRIAFARQMNIRISETTITEELLYRFYKVFSDRSIPIRLFESVAEHKNGSDIEIFIKTNWGFILLACQSKITYKTGSYKSFYHKVKDVPQIDLLRNYAENNGGIAQYLLYNYIPTRKMSKAFLESGEDESYGITQVSADQIYQWMAEIENERKKPIVPGFNAFHPKLAHPLHELICSLLGNDEPFDGFFPATSMDKLRYYNEDDVVNSQKWLEIQAAARIGYIEPEMVLEYEIDENLDGQNKNPNVVPVFSPKFRLVIGSEPLNGTLYRLR